MNNFRLYSEYYDLLYKEKPYSEESDFIISLLDKYRTFKVKTILELGSGSGGHAHFFSKKGFEITGIELSPGMVEMARTKNIPNFNIIEGNISSFNLEMKFDAVVSLFHVVSYLTNNADLISMFNSVNNNLKEGGLFIFDCWYSPAVIRQRPETRVKRISNENLSIVRIAESKENVNNNTVNVDFEVNIKKNNDGQVSTIEESHLMRHFSIPEIQLIANFCGFEVIKCEEALTSNIPSCETWAVCFVLKKNSYE